MPFLVPRTYCPICYEVVRTRFYNSASVVYFCFTLYKTTGDTIYFAYGGLMGTVIAVINIWALMGFFPGGYVPGQPNAEAIFWMINVWGALYVFFMLYLNLDGNTRVFGLTTFVWYWMAALNHHVVTGFAHNFEIKLNGGAMGELCCAASGCCIAIVASCLPTPLLATYKMNDTGKFLVRKLHSVWGDFIEYYTGEEKNPYSQNVLGKDLASLQSAAGTLSPFITSAYYECMGMGAPHRRRMMMKVLDSYLSECFNRLSCVLSACLSEEFDDTHDALMKRVRASMTDAIDKVGGLLSVCEDRIIACGWDDESKSVAETLKADLNKTIDEMTKQFLKASKEMDLYKVSDSIAGEFLVGSNLCCWARLTCKFCDDLQGELPSEKNRLDSWRWILGSLCSWHQQHPRKFELCAPWLGLCDVCILHWLQRCRGKNGQELQCSFGEHNLCASIQVTWWSFGSQLNALAGRCSRNCHRAGCICFVGLVCVVGLPLCHLLCLLLVTRHNVHVLSQ